MINKSEYSIHALIDKIEQQLRIDKKFEYMRSSILDRKLKQHIFILFSYLKEAADLEEPDIFLNYYGWFSIYHMQTEYGSYLLTQIFNILREQLDQYVPTIYVAFMKELLTQAIIQLEEGFKQQESYLKSDDPFYSEAVTYLQVLLHDNEVKATQYILSLYNKGLHVKHIYEQIFQPVLYEVGRLWLEQSLTVAQEHYASRTTQNIMAKLMGRAAILPRLPFMFIGTCVGEESHDIGIRMVSDYFILLGWEAYYIGGNVPLQELISTLTKRKVDILGVSVTMPYHIHVVRDMIQEIRNYEVLHEMTIIVGGYAFAQTGNLWKRIGADGYVKRASDVLQLIHEKIA
jgi:MerR family transcriptional regulator, light-induced transcriptional regulator